MEKGADINYVKLIIEKEKSEILEVLKILNIKPDEKLMSLLIWGTMPHTKETWKKADRYNEYIREH